MTKYIKMKLNAFKDIIKEKNKCYTEYKKCMEANKYLNEQIRRYSKMTGTKDV